MPRRAGADVYRLSVRGAGPLARDFSRAQRQIQDALVAELRRLGDDALDAFRDEAPEDTGDLHDALVAVPYFLANRPRVSIRVEPLDGHEGSERDGYDYFEVTRRGHRASRIHPKQAQALKVHLYGHRNPHLAVFRASVAGVGHPGPASTARAVARAGRARVVDVRSAHEVIDWTDVAGERSEALAAVAERRLGRRLESRLLRR